MPDGLSAVSTREFPDLASLLPSDAFDTSTHQVMGRRVAGSSFARGLCATLKASETLTVFSGGVSGTGAREVTGTSTTNGGSGSVTPSLIPS